MASCELDYRLPASNSESMEYEEETDSDDDTKLRIVDAADSLAVPPRALVRSLSVGAGEAAVTRPLGAASDAVESLLLLGQCPVFSSSAADAQAGQQQEAGGLRGSFPKYSHQVEQRMMVNYYQKMRERNNEASKRCRLKRRIKQDSLEKTRQLLESHQEALGNRVAKLHKIKDILNDACRSTGREDHVCECLSFCAKIKKIQKEMPDFPDLSNHEIIKKSRMVRDTNLEEILGSSSTEIADMRPLKRGPRKQEAEPGFTINTDLRSIKPDSPATAVLDLSSSSAHRAAPLNLSKSTTAATSVTAIKLEPTAPQQRFSTTSLGQKTFPSLAPKVTPITMSPRKVIVDNPNLGLPQSVIPLVGHNVSTHSSLTNTNKSTISLHGNFNGTNTIILTPLVGNPSLTSTILNLPSLQGNKAVVVKPEVKQSADREPAEQPSRKVEPEIVIKSEPDINIVEIDTELETTVKTEAVEMEVEKDPTVSCAAVIAGKESALSCSRELLDLNSLTQTLDLVTMDPKSAGELTAAEKYIIKSRLEIEFWKAEETASFICSAHRRNIVRSSNMHSCSVCGNVKRKSKKIEMYFITYRMAVEFYMTNGRFLSIGLLACSHCKLKSLKGLDFSNSYLVPESGGHPLQPALSSPAVKREAEEERGGVGQPQVARLLLRDCPPRTARDVVLPPSAGTQGMYSIAN